MKKREKTDVLTEKRQIKRLFLWAVIMALVCVILGISVLLYFFAPRDYDTYVITVPSLVGLDEKEIGSYDGIELKREWVYSDELERGRVISQTPYASARRKVRYGERCEVTVYISLGEKKEKIPALCGVDQISAASALHAIGAKVRSVAIYGEGEDGAVIGTFPKENVEIKTGETVTMFVLRKRVESPVTIPNFLGMEQSDATRLALSLGLFIGDIENDGEGMRVSAQSIPSGARVLRGSYISFKTGIAEERERSWPPVPE